MKATSLVQALTIIIVGLLASIALFSITEANRLRVDSRVDARAMCTSEMFCYIPVYNQSSSRRAVTVPCSSNSGRPGFDTQDGFLHIGDYYFNAPTNTYFAYARAFIGATSTSENFICNSPRLVESTTMPEGIREVHPIGDVFTAQCTLDGKDVYVTIPPDEFSSPGIPRMIDPYQQVNCIYAGTIQSSSSRGR